MKLAFEALQFQKKPANFVINSPLKRGFFILLFIILFSREHRFVLIGKQIIKKLEFNEFPLEKNG